MRRRRAPVVVECDGGWRGYMLRLAGPGPFAEYWAAACEHARAAWLTELVETRAASEAYWSRRRWAHEQLAVVEPLLTAAERELAGPVLAEPTLRAVD